MYVSVHFFFVHGFLCACSFCVHICLSAFLIVCACFILLVYLCVCFSIHVGLYVFYVSVKEGGPQLGWCGG